MLSGLVRVRGVLGSTPLVVSGGRQPLAVPGGLLGQRAGAVGLPLLRAALLRLPRNLPAVA